jgi:predicted metal-binding membrane protein
MAALALVTFAEQVSPWGERIRILVGVVLISVAAYSMREGWL